MNCSSNDGNSIKLRPIAGGTIFVFNSEQYGMFKTVSDRINKLKEDQEKNFIPMKVESLVAFGPFDRVIRLDVDDFCLVNTISSLPGISSQQIQCAYSVWSSHQEDANEKYFKPFCIITQLKIHNHLILRSGPEIEEAIAGLLSECLKEYVSEDVKIELMATLGWEEYFIFIRNYNGYLSLFRPIIEKIRGLTLYDLKYSLESKNRIFNFGNFEKIELNRKHIFLTTYSTPCYSLELSHSLEENFVRMLEEKGPQSLLSCDEVMKCSTLFNNVKLPSGKVLPEYFGNEKVSASLRLSIKPGHLKEVRKIISEVLGTYDERVCNKFFSIGRYDVYPWLAATRSCKELVIMFELLMFSLSGNLRGEEKYSEFMKRSQFYNSFTIISYIEEEKPQLKDSEEKGNEVKWESKHLMNEGGFVSQLEKLSLGYKGGVSIDEAFKKERKGSFILSKILPSSITIGLSRIFSLFDSCITDRFTCDSFIDMYPFMYRVREIIDTLEIDLSGTSGDDPLLSFSTNKGGNKKISLPESKKIARANSYALVKVFYDAIQRFYQGFSHRYLSSYPMMDKNETGVDFSGRLHRILSAVTGMQNLLLDDMDCHLKKGFTIISPYPHIRIYRDSFNVTEANVFHLFQPEIFYSMYHEIMHTFISADELSNLRNRLNELIEIFPNQLPGETIERIKLIFQEIAGDIILLKNGFYSNFKLYSFWYWLLLIQSKKDFDSHIILRFLLLSALEDIESRKIIFEFSDKEDTFEIRKPEVLINIFKRLISRLDYPKGIEYIINENIKVFFDSSNTEKNLIRTLGLFVFLLPTLESIHPFVISVLNQYVYPPDVIDNNIDQLYEKMPLRPEILTVGEKEKRQKSSIRMFRGILTFIYENRKHLICDSDSILNFSPSEVALRAKLFHFRIGLINTLQWESLNWKKKILEEEGIDLRYLITENQNEGIA
ncbi:MAG: hypothetical protein NT166_26005 [Candidatus Aminicenantes bacterium]|nr:hypothetical protein [Candidatus Aminicenantes bacterium]